MKDVKSMLENIFLTLFTHLFTHQLYGNLMPNDLGQPLNGMIRNNCRLEYDVHRKTPRVEALRLTLAEKLLKS